MGVVASSSILGLAANPIHAESAAIAPAAAQPSDMRAYVPPVALQQFRPSDNRKDHQIDYSFFDEALEWFVVPMGPSIREGARRVEQRLGSRRIYGHESRYRMEGNRVAFSYFTDDVRTSLSQYRADLERVGTALDVPSLPRNEQLAFWFNLHNVAVIEALAGEYPLTQPGMRTYGSNDAPLDDAKLVTVSGVELSPRDIRERIVYPNWKDPRVIYGFWRGEIGGPSIQRAAFSADNVNQLLAFSAEEFVNSLRGVESTGKTLRVSRIFEEAAPFYFQSDAALRAHLSAFARDEVKDVIAKTNRTITNQYEQDLADLARGERTPYLGNLFVNTDFLDGAGQAVRSRPNLAIQRLMEERRQKLNRAWRRGIRTGQVIIGEGGLEAKEVE